MQEPVIKYVEACRDDLRAAQTLLNEGQTFYIPFLCHQALNKILRGYSLAYLNRYPPLTDDLLAVADDTEAGMWMDEGTRDFVDSLSVYPKVIVNPVYRAKILERNPPDACKKMLTRTTEIADMVQRLIEKL